MQQSDRLVKESVYRCREWADAGQGADGLRAMAAVGKLALLLLHVAAAAALATPGSTGAAPGANPLRRRLPVAARLLASMHGGAEARTLRPLSGVQAISMQGAADGASALSGELTLRLRGGKKGTSSQGKRGTGGKSHPSYKYNLSYPRISRHSTSKRKRYCIKKKPQGTGRCKHLRLVNRRFKHGFRCAAPYAGPKELPTAESEA